MAQQARTSTVQRKGQGAGKLAAKKEDVPNLAFFMAEVGVLKRGDMVSISLLELGPRHYQMLCRCQYPGCVETMRVELVGAEATYPDDQHLVSRFVSLQPGARKNPIIILHAYLRRLGRPLSESIALTEATYEQALAAMKAGDLAALHAVDREYTPFYCRQCPGVYCYEHMGYEEVWEDDDYSVSPDYWKGQCPSGHPQFRDH